MPGKPKAAPPAPPAGQPTDDQVAAFLRAKPDFLARHPELMRELAAPGRALGGGVADFQGFLIERLQADTRRLVDQGRGLRSLTAQVHKATLALVAAPDFGLLIEVVTTDLAAHLGVDVALLAVETDALGSARAEVAGVRCVPDGTIDAVMGPDHAVAIVADGKSDARLFGAAAGLVRSAAVVRLGGTRGLPPAALCIGTRIAGRFHPSHGAEPLRFLAEVLEQCLRTRLRLPA